MAKNGVKILSYATLFSLICLSSVSIANEVGGEGATDGSSAAVPGITAVYNVLRSYPGHSDIACILGDFKGSLITHLVPPHLSNPTFKDRTWMKEVDWHRQVESEAARGGVCGTSANPLYNVSFPLMSSRARLQPEFLSYTVSVGEDLRVRVRGATPYGKLWWQKEVVTSGSWREANVSHDGAFVIPAMDLLGSGFYSFVDESDVRDTGLLGTFSLAMRDCPKHRYGESCEGWCRDCMYGAECHPRTGKCVCQEGTMGEQCQIRCTKGMGGHKCSDHIMNIPGRQTCHAFPTPCACLAGYTGGRCDTACAVGRWGMDCAQFCHHHCQGNCDAETGECDALGPTACYGGDIGLPRLRIAPKVTNIGAEAVIVEFSNWTAGYDDGEREGWDSLSYVIRLRQQSTQKYPRDLIASGQSQMLTNLTPVTRYEVKVMVRVVRSASNLTCMADGSGRERVHSVFFTTTCPEDISSPIILKTEKISSTSVFVKWQGMNRPKGCEVKYHLTAVPQYLEGEVEASKIINLTLTNTHAEVEGLKPNVPYTIRVRASSVTNSIFFTTSSSTLFEIHENTAGQAMMGGIITAVGGVTVIAVILFLWRRGRVNSSNEETYTSVYVEETSLPTSSSPSPPPVNGIDKGEEEESRENMTL